MQYRKFGKHDFEVSALGYGTMRMPIIDDDNGNIDEEQSKKLLRHAIDNGVTYIDTAYPYHNGNSEAFIGRALKDGYRERVLVATKSPIWLCRKHEDYEKFLDEQLERLGLSSIDLYLVHSMDDRGWNKIKELGIFEFFEKAKSEGKIKYIGFSYHDEVALFKEIIDFYDWDMCQIQLNYMDAEYQAGVEGLKYAAEKGMAVVIMEPLKGGLLANEPPIGVQEIWDTAEVSKKPAEWALKWLYNFPEVTCVLSGMNELVQIDENIKTADETLPNSMGDNDLKRIDEAVLKFKELTKINCTGCHYCMPCTAKVDIPMNFEYYNRAYMHGNIEFVKAFYNRPLFAKRTATHCIACGECLSKCPQHLNIPELLKKISTEFDC